VEYISLNFYNKSKLKVQGYLKQFINSAMVDVQDLKIGKNVFIEPGVEIHCRRMILGDSVIIKSGTRIEMTDLVIGDYTVINNNCFLTGTDWCRIGHNCWFGHYSILDSIGTTRIGDGVGVGAHSQLWTHIYFGDNLEGCRFASAKPLNIEDDVWFVGHCIISPITAKKRSMILAGSVVTKDLEEDHVYGGVPAVDLTEKIGPQFTEKSLQEKRILMEKYLEEFYSKYKPIQNRIKIVDKIDPNNRCISQFSLTERLYMKNLYKEEIEFMRFLLPTKAKFLPFPETDWISSYIQS
jgi:acetyltransferase-like isoleucine patch superfamily enzyme